MKVEDFSIDAGSQSKLIWNDADDGSDDDDDDDDDGDSLSENDSSNEKKNKFTNKRKFGSDIGTNKKKIRRERKIAPPTAEEMINLRETETLFKSNLFRLEIEQMIVEIKPLKTFQNAFNLWMESFKLFCKHLVDSEDWIHLKDSDDILGKMGVCFPLPNLEKNHDGHYKFLKPSDVKTVGSFFVDCTMGPKFNVDVAVTIPKGCFRKKDYLNQTYHYKRALYLCTIAEHLKKSELLCDNSNIMFSCLNGDSLKPVLILNPRGKIAHKVEIRLYAVPEEGTFKLNRFLPNLNNVRRSWWGLNNIIAESPASPFYNTSILEDMVMKSNEIIRQEAFKDNNNMKEAICLLRVWLRQRNLDQGPGAFTTYLISMLLVYLKDIQKINKHMSSYQVIRNIWLYLSQSKWNEDGLSMCKENGDTVPPVCIFHRFFDVVFIDPSGYVNLTSRMNKLTYLKVQRESAKAIELLDSNEVSGFQALFMVKIPFIQQYDHLISFSNEDTMNLTVDRNCSSGSDIDFNGDPVPLFCKLVGDLLIKGVRERAIEIGVMLSEPPRWNVNERRSSFLTDIIVFGIRLHPENALNIVDKGPQANLPEAAEFRDFWCGKSELRRFKDGVVCECMVWDESSLPISKRFNLTKKVSSFLLQNKLGIDSNEYTYVADQLHYVITPKMVDVSAEETCIQIHKSVEELSRQLVELEHLSLEVTTVHCISSSYRYAEVFPATPPLRYFKQPSSLFTPMGHRLENPVKAPYYFPTIDLVLEVTFTRKWPDDLAACRRLTSAFYLAIGNKLEEKHKLKYMVHSDCILVQKDGYMFRLFLMNSKEISLLKLNTTKEGVKQYKDTQESIELEKKCIHLPKLTGALHGLSVAEAGFSGGARLVKRWICAHMLDSFHFPPIIAELMVANLFLKPQPYNTLLQPQQIFLRFLQLLATTNWQTEFLLINFNKLLAKEEIDDIEKKFNKERNSFPPLVVVTPYDGSGSQWTRKIPTFSTLVRLAKLASTTLNILQLKLFFSQPTSFYNSIFTPNLDLYDVVIKLSLSMIPRKAERVSWKFSNKIKKTSKNGDKVDSEKPFMVLPVVNFDPAQLFLEYLRENYEEFALFFHDSYGGSNIGVLFKPITFETSEFRVSTIGGRCPNYEDDPVSLKTNFKALINDFREIGEGIVESISYNAKMKKMLKT